MGCQLRSTFSFPRDLRWNPRHRMGKNCLKKHMCADQQSDTPACGVCLQALNEGQYTDSGAGGGFSINDATFAKDLSPPLTTIHIYIPCSRGPCLYCREIGVTIWRTLLTKAGVCKWNSSFPEELLKKDVRLRTSFFVSFLYILHKIQK